MRPGTATGRARRRLCAKSPPHFIEGDCERWSRKDVLLLCRRGHRPALANLPPGGQRYLATKYLHSLADGEKGLRKAIVLLRENMAAKNQAALRKLEGAGNGAGGDAYTDAAAGSNRRPVPNAGQQREVTPIADETH